MAIVKSFNGQNIYKPGPYSKFRVENTGPGLESNDTLFIVGESTKGAPGSSEGIQEFSASNLTALIDKYGAGPIVDCALAARTPSRTPGIGGAGRYLVYKTNASTQAEVTLEQSASDYADVADREWGVSGNNLAVVVAAGSGAQQKNISVTKLGDTTEALGENDAVAILDVQYTGDATTGVMAIAGATRAALTLTTTLAGDQSDGSVNLSITLQDYTIKELVDYINAQTGYSANLLSVLNSAKNASELDPIASGDVKTAAVDLFRLQKEIIELINTSARVQATEPTQPLGGVPDEIANAPLTGGAQGASTNTSFSNAFAASLAEEYNVLLPAISRDASVDIADADLGFTDAASTYTRSAVLAAQASHLRLRGNTKNRKEAQGMAGVRESAKATAFSAISTIGDENMQVAMQDCVFVDATGNLKVGQPHVFAAFCAGIRLGTDVGEPLTHKFLNVVQVGHILDPDDFSEGGDFNPNLDVDDAIINGVLFSEKISGGNRIVVDNTTYGVDDSFIFNRGSVIEASYFVFKTLRETAESVFIGKKVSNGLADSIKNVVRNRLRELNQPDVQIITSSDDAPEGFVEETFVVTVSGNTATVRVEFKPVQGLDFVFFDFTLGDIQQSA